METKPQPPFTPNTDTAVVIGRLLDIYEQRQGQPKHAVRTTLADLTALLPGYYSQIDPTPRLVANEQLSALERRGWVAVTWEPGQKGHLIDTVTLIPEAAASLYALLQREPRADQQRRLRDLLLGNRFRVHDWRRLALDWTLEQLESHKSPAPFTPGDDENNQDLLDALLALPENVVEELPYRVFSVRVFNDSKRFEPLKPALARLARQTHPEWSDFTNQEILQELGLVPNPTLLHLAGPWELSDETGRALNLSAFQPAVGIPAALAARLTAARVRARRVICVENLTPFYSLLQQENPETAAFCLWGNPSPAARRLLGALAADLPGDIPLYLWSDIDYGGFNILAQLRREVSPRFQPYRMDIDTLQTFAHWGKPLTVGDLQHLTRLRRHPLLEDMQPLLEYMLRREIKLEQEAIILENKNKPMV
jgi:hypothetical protein